MNTFSKNIAMSELRAKILHEFHHVRTYKQTSEALRKQLEVYIYNPLREKYPSGKAKHSNYLKGYAQGIIDAERDSIMQNEVEFCYLVDGTLYSTHKQSTHQTTEVFYKEGKGHLLGNYPSNFYWKGTDKPYTTL